MKSKLTILTVSGVVMIIIACRVLFELGLMK